jgi:hypothetical protein
MPYTPINFTTESINSKQLFRWDNMVWYCGVNLAFGTPQYEKSLIDYNSIEADRVVLTLTSDARFNLSSSSRTPFKIFCKVFDAPATLRLRDASGFYWDRELPVSDWTLISPNWSEFVWSPINPVIQQGRSPDQSANIQELYILTNNKIQIWWIGSNPPEPLSLPTTIYRAGVRDSGSGDRSLYVGDIYPTNTPSDTLNYTPGVVPFARNIINGSVGNLTGLPYSAYQNVWGLVKWAEESRLNNVIQFIKDAQVAYTSSVGDVGPFAPVYTWNDPNNASTGDTINTFGFNGFDNFEQSGEYQAQLGLWLARAWYENRSNSDLRTLAMSWLNWLDQVYGTRQDTLPPNTFPSNSIATAGNNPGVQALIGEAALWCNLSGGDPATTFRWIYRSLTYLNSQFVGAGNPMSGSWSNSQPVFDTTLKQYYSWWHGAAINFLSLLEQHKPEITYPSCSEPLNTIVSEPFAEVCCGGITLICPTWIVNTSLRTNSITKSIETTRNFRGGFVLEGVGTSNPNRTSNISGGSGTITYQLPEGTISICKAYLWWNIITDQNTDLPSITVNEQTITGSQVGQGGRTCWASLNNEINKVYRSDVTNLITSTSGSLTVSGFPETRVRFGSNPILDSSQGAALLIVYTSIDGEPMNLDIYDGCVTLPGPALSVPLEATSIKKLGVAVGDGQPFSSGALRINNYDLTPNGGTWPFGGDGSFMDTLVFDVPDSVSPPYTITNTYFNDCLSWFLFVHAY